MRALQIFAAGLAVAAALFWTTMLTTPPASQAAVAQGLDRASSPEGVDCVSTNICP